MKQLTGSVSADCGDRKWGMRARTRGRFSVPTLGRTGDRFVSVFPLHNSTVNAREKDRGTVLVSEEGHGDGSLSQFLTRKDKGDGSCVRILAT